MHSPQPDVRELSSGYKFEHPHTDTTIRLDFQGRWLSYRCGTYLYRRCMNGDVVCGKGEEVLSPTEKIQLISQIAVTLDRWARYWKWAEKVKTV